MLGLRTIFYGHDIRLLQPVAGLYLCFGGYLARPLMVNEDDVAGTASILTNMGIHREIGLHYNPGAEDDDIINDIEEDILDYSTDEADSYYSDDDDFDDFEDDAQLQWEESLEELEQLLKCILIPFFGRYAGRKFAYYVWMKLAARIYL